ncbi:ligand-binding sensor domain-containing protein/AraC-like DNA-binding protein [Parabacteroides sp. PFB2-12]|nr:ligand-binding sensor domain-containing protein/AraC-like DNA-binding protein [Parabacteroides sp. PM6-13]MDH6390413.1 ligand-binding sensor domain-containing protein/AraC-like DNA-binding protein [Parabacteroides sp. PFB2-12]
MRAMKRKSLFMFLLVGCLQVFAAWAIPFRSLSVDDGLSNNFIRKIYKDSQGFIWLGMQNGLDRFDGISIEHYITPQENLGAIYDILETDASHLWIATDKGLWNLHIIDKHISKDNSPIDCPIYSLATDEKGQLLVGTENGLFVKIGDDFRHYPLFTDNYSSVRIFGILPDENQSCWLATNNNLYHCDYSGEEPLFTFYSDNVHRAFYAPYRNGPNIYLGTRGAGIFRFNIRTKQFSKYIDVGNDAILYLSGDGKDILWAGTDGDGLKKISLSQNSVIATYQHDRKNTSSISSNAIYSFLEDNGRLWIGTYSTGLNYSLQHNFNVYDFQSFHSLNHRVRALCIQKNEKLIGTRDGLIYIDENRNLLREFYAKQPETRALQSNTITAIHPYGKGYLIGTLEGLCFFDPATLSFRLLDDQIFTSGAFYHFASDKQHHIWMATFKGIIRLQPNGEFVRYTAANSSLIDNLVHSTMIDSFGRVWAGTKSGVCYFDPEEEDFKKVDCLHPSMDNCKVTHIFEDSNANIWFCTETNGLYTVNSSLSNSNHYTTAHSLPYNAISSIMEDELGYYWVATQKGLFRGSFTDHKSQTFWLSDGLPGLTFNPAACYYEEEKKRLWWGNENGLIYCDLNQIHTQTDIDPIRLTQLYINGKEITTGEKPLRKSINEESEIKLSWLQNSFGFRFITLDYIYPYDNIFETMLEGHMDDWQTLGRGQTTISYEDVAPGKYLFRVRLQNSPEFEKQIHVIVTPQWSLAALAALFIILLLLWIWYWRRLKRLINKANKKIKNKISKPEPDNKDYTEQYQALLTLMEEKKRYLDPELKMSHLTAELKCSNKELTLIFRDAVQKSFADFVNEYRVNEFIKKINAGEQEKYTIVALAQQCGFNSRSSFFRIFKNVTGQTPQEYMKQIKSENKCN